MEEQRITLPQELLAQIIIRVGDEQRPGRYLGKCALVSKNWLQEARHAFFLGRTVYIDGSPHDKLLRELLDQNEPICTFWPYILDMRIDGRYSYYTGDTKASDDYIRLLALCLSRASNLRTIWIDRMRYSDSLKDAISSLTATKTITSIRIDNSYFPSPKELDLFIGLFPQLRFQCRLRFIKFYTTTPSYIVSAVPSLPFSISIRNGESMLKHILNHQWNVTNLHIRFLDVKSANFPLLTNVLKHIGASLKSLSLDLCYCGFSGPLPLSLSYLTSLQSVHILGLPVFLQSDPLLQLPWLAPVFNTIKSRESFQDLKICLSCDVAGYGNSKAISQWLTSIDWAPVEDAILDFGRFSGEPTLTLVLMGGPESKLDRSVVKEKCMPRLVKAGRLMAVEGYDGKAIIIK